MEWYRPSAVVLQCGGDSLSGDKLGCFNLSMKGQKKLQVVFIAMCHRRFNPDGFRKRSRKLRQFCEKV